MIFFIMVIQLIAFRRVMEPKQKLGLSYGKSTDGQRLIAIHQQITVMMMMMMMVMIIKRPKAGLEIIYFHITICVKAMLL